MEKGRPQTSARRSAACPFFALLPLFPPGADVRKTGKSGRGILLIIPIYDMMIFSWPHGADAEI